MPASPSEPGTAVAIDGRPLGRRAQETRRRLLDATHGLLRSRGIRELRVVDIARSVGTSPATFYQYFGDVESAVLVLAQEVGDEVDPVAAHVDEPWRGAAGLAAARALVDDFITYWDRYRAILRVRNLAAEEGDQRFRAARNGSLGRITVRLRRQIEDAQAAGRVSRELSPYAAAAGLVAMMERMAAHHLDLEPRGTSRQDVVDTVSRIVHSTVTGRRP